MGIKSIAVAGAATAVLSAGLAAPALAAEPFNHNGDHRGGCKRFCVAQVTKNGVHFGTVRVFVGRNHIRGVLHLTRDAKKGFYKIRGHCRPVEHEDHVDHVERTFEHHEVREVPQGTVRTGFGAEQVNMPLVGGALAMIAGGLGVGVLARRRLTGARS